MGQVELAWTPPGDAATSLTFNANETPRVFRGLANVDRALTITPGGTAVTTVHSGFRQYQVEFRGIRRFVDKALFGALTEWVGHVLEGGKFSFAYDSGKKFSSTLSAQVNQGSNEIFTVATPSAVAVDDWIWLRHPTLTTRFAAAAATAVDTGAKKITLGHNLKRTFPSGSIVTHLDYIPLAVILEDESPLLERPAPNGAGLYELSFTVRAVTA